MPEMPKKKPNCKEKKDAQADPSTWEEDQKRREYYYDDAHGYEKYDPDSDDEHDEKDED